MHHLRLSLAVLTGASLIAGCSDSSSGGGSVPAQSLAPDAAVAWFDELYATIRDEALSPPVASRLIGYCGVTAYESVVDGMKGYRSLGGQLNDLDPLPEAERGRYHWPAVMNAALADVIVGLLPGASGQTLIDLAALEDALDADFDANLPEAVLTRSRARGAQIATEILAWSATDGFATWNNCAYVPPVEPGAWEPTPPAFAANPLQPCWGRIRPMVLLFGAECPSLPPPSFSTNPTSAFYAEALEVQAVVDDIKANLGDPNEERDDIARFWADNPGATGTPPGHWIRIVSQVVDQYDMTLADAVQGYVRVGLAVNDAFISCWDMKYYYNLLRPITFIQDPAGINDPGWTTLESPALNTPPFPEYTSGHSVQSGAASRVLTDLWGDLAFDDATNSPQRSFDSFDAAADEAAISRLYGGIHFRSGIDRGVQQGRCVGQTIVANIEFLE
jgi:hypothetical protein